MNEKAIAMMQEIQQLSQRVLDELTGPVPELTPEPEPAPQPAPAPTPVAGEIPRMRVHRHGGGSDLFPDFGAIARPITSLRDVTTGEVVVIPANTTVHLDHEMDVIPKAICVKGALRVSRTGNTRLRCGTLMVYPGCIYDAGTSEDPITGNLKISIEGTVDRIEDPEQASIGIIATGGVFTIHGGFSGDIESQLVDPAAADDSEIRVTRNGGWDVGDEVLITTTEVFVSMFSLNQTERRSIAAIDGDVVTLNSPLKFAHQAGAYVVHVSRNITVEATGDPGHLLFGGTTLGNVSLATFKNFGRTTNNILNDTVRTEDGTLMQVGDNQRGRYGLHAHCAVNPVVFHGNVCYVPDGSKVAIAIHSSHARVTKNVMYGRIDGCGIFAEAGNETGAVDGNIVISTLTHTSQRVNVFGKEEDYWRRDLKAPLGSPLGDEGYGGHGMWFAGPLMDITDNKLIGAFYNAIQINPEIRHTVTVHSGPLKGRSFDPRKVPPVFRRNFARSSGWRGFVFWGFESTTINLQDCVYEVTNHFNGGPAGLGYGSGCTLVLDRCSMRVGGAYALNPDPQQKSTLAGVHASGHHAELILRHSDLSGWRIADTDPNFKNRFDAVIIIKS